MSGDESRAARCGIMPLFEEHRMSDLDTCLETVPRSIRFIGEFNAASSQLFLSCADECNGRAIIAGLLTRGCRYGMESNRAHDAPASAASQRRADACHGNGACR